MTCLIYLVSSRGTDHNARHLKYICNKIFISHLKNVIDLLAETVEEFNVIGGTSSECQDTGPVGGRQMPDCGESPGHVCLAR